MIDWNIVLYIGLVIMVFGFGLFLYSEIKLREIDRKIAENDRFINAVLRMREDNNNGWNERTTLWNNRQKQRY